MKWPPSLTFRWCLDKDMHVCHQLDDFLVINYHHVGTFGSWLSLMGSFFTFDYPVRVP